MKSVKQILQLKTQLIAFIPEDDKENSPADTPVHVAYSKCFVTFR